MRLNNIINILIISAFILLLLFSFYIANKGEEVKLKYLSNTSFSKLYEELSSNNFTIQELEKKEISLLLKKSKDFSFFNDKDLISFMNRYKKKYKDKYLKVKIYYKDNDEDMVFLGVYNKSKDHEYIKYDKSNKMLVFFPENLNYVNISSRKIY